MIDDVLGLIDSGRVGESVYIPTRHPRFGRYFGLRRGHMSYVGGDSGTGKSAFAHQTWILDAIKWMLDNPETEIKLKIFAWLMERPLARTKGKWICQKLWEDHGILMDVDFMFGEGSRKSRIPDDIYKRVKETRDYFERASDMLVLHHKENPTGIRNTMMSWAKANGKKIRHSATDKRTGLVREWTDYLPDDPKLITICLVDHIGILGDERSFTHKQKLDKMSEYAREMRDDFGFSPVLINQFNRNKSDSTRRTKMIVVPEASDFDGSSNPFKDCDLAIGLLDPNKLNIKDHMGYKIPSMISRQGSRFRALTIMKNTYGPDDIHSGFRFVGEVGQFKEILRPDEMTEKDYKDMTKLRTSFSMPED